VLCAAVCLLLLHSALDVVARRTALKYAAPVLQPQVGGLGAGFAVEDRAQWRRGCDGPAWCPPPGLALGERPWPLMTGESAGTCGVLAPSLYVAQLCLCRLISLLASFLLEWQENRGQRCFV